MSAGPIAVVRGALHLWWVLALAGMRAQMQYRATFAVRAVVDLFVVVSDMAPAWLLARFFGSLDGWSFAELALLYGMVGSSWAAIEIGLRGFENFAVYLVRGDLDRVLLRPRSIVLQVAALDFEARKFARLLQALVVLALSCSVLGLDARALAWVALGVAGGALCFAGIVMAGAALQFWTLGQTSELQNILTYGGSAALTFPVSIYATWFRRAVTYGVPLAFVNYFPALAALERTAEAGWPEWVPALSPVVCALVLAFGLGAFRLGLRRYESTGS